MPLRGTAIVSFANHAHVFPAAMNADGTIDQLLRYMDACDIAQAVCFAPFTYQAKDKSFDPNGWLAGEIRGRDRLHAFGTIDFERADDQAAQVRRIRDLGFKGIKIHPPGQKLDLLSARGLAAYEAAQDAGLFITFHSGIHHHRIRDARVVDFDDIAYKFPRLRFSMEHVGGWSFFNEACAVIANNIPPPWEPGVCNVYAGLTSIYSPDTLPFWYMPRERFLELIRQTGGVRQLIFGLDFPYNDIAATKRGIEMIRSLELKDEETNAIFGGNLKRELGVA
jgi:predicted TIM-barrel fold metal-dependent hydrolase